MRHGGEVAHHHAEAVVERHWDTEAVCRRQANGFADKASVVQDIAMGERGAFRKARGAAGELDVHRVGTLQFGRHGRKSCSICSAVGECVERHEAGVRRFAERCNEAQVGQAGADRSRNCCSARAGRADGPTQLPQHP